MRNWGSSPGKTGRFASPRLYAMLRTLFIVCFCLSANLLLSPSAQAEITLVDIRLGPNGNGTRFVVDSDAPIEPSLFSLLKPNRLVIDIADAKFVLPSDKQQNADGVRGVGLISSYRFGSFRQGLSRIVLDLKTPAQVARTFSLSPSANQPYRYVIDLVPVDAKTFRTAVRKGAAARLKAKNEQGLQPVARPQPKPNGDQRPLIVIDPGHGGIDPGTTGKNGALEKNIVLTVAKQLKIDLEKTGRFRVRLTRTTDVFIPLYDRAPLAKRWGADLFVSLHADAIDNPKVRGATVYTLAEKASDREAAQLANRENKSDLIAGVDLSSEPDEIARILIELTQRESMNNSAKLARVITPELAKVTTLRTNSHRFADFVVLRAPDIPAVLVEMGYLSNTKDETYLRSKAGQAKVSRAISRAIEDYFAKTASLQQ